ncbi:MAG: type I DNA topoisomerase [Ruminococcaceae bacterium]|nr:type I DNA topoisomerase [Oscillospiraceae bacterium]
MANLVILESPAKANTVKGYLGTNYRVIASKGHIRDLPKSSLGIDVENNFKPHYINIRGKGDVIKELKKEAKAANKIFIATDPDREGEAIAWHIATELGIPESKACRVTFNEITKKVVKEAIKAPRRINMDLVNSQQARRILDRLVGFNLSEVLWKNVGSGLSGGRVQSVAVRIIAEREKEISEFVPKEYWTIDAELTLSSSDTISARYFGNAQGKIKPENEKQASGIESKINSGEFKVISVKHAEKHKMPAPPFTTSTLQQEASKKLGFQSHKTMKVAQELYDGLNLGYEFGGVQGLITYMRTDSIRISKSAMDEARDYIKSNLGEEYLPEHERVYRSKNNAQDAHEAIRPSSVLLTPKNIKKMLSTDQYKLYKLIWERFIASQMESAVLDTVAIDIENSGEIFKTGGQVLKSVGFMALYDNSDDEAPDDEIRNMSKLPDVKEGDVLSPVLIEKKQHYTEPPARYTEASLIKFLEENGIGRPSTYAPIISIIISRDYVRREGKLLIGTKLGEITTDFMKEYFPEIVDYEFTAGMESNLDAIANNETTIEELIGGFYKNFDTELKKATESKTDKHKQKLPAEESEFDCPKCGKKMIYKTGRFGKFLACPDYPSCRSTIAVDKNGVPQQPKERKIELADFKCEVCGGDMVVRNGRYGTFYACRNYPKCKFTKQKVVDIGVSCPKCGSKIIGKHAKEKVLFYSCEKYPECDFSTWDKPLSEKCPECNENLYYRKTKRAIVCKNPKCDYKRDEEMMDEN